MAAKRGNGGGPKGNESVEILRAIWNEMKALNSRVDQTNQRIDQTNQRLDALGLQLKGEIDLLRREVTNEVDLLRRRIVESEVRLATTTTELSADVRELSSLIRDWREEHRADRAEMKMRLGRLEDHVGIGSPR